MGVAHILVKHSGSRRPASRLDPAGAAIRARAPADARERALVLRARLGAAADAEARRAAFAALAEEASDCNSAVLPSARPLFAPHSRC